MPGLLLQNARKSLNAKDHFKALERRLTMCRKCQTFQ